MRPSSAERAVSAIAVSSVAVSSSAAGPAAEPARAGVRLALLNRFELSQDGVCIALPLPAQRLVAFLAVQDRVVLRTYAASMLWIDSTEEHAFGSLRSALWRLRQVDCCLVEGTSRDLRLAAAVDVDLSQATTSARRICELASGLEDVEVDIDAAAFVGDLLPDWYDDWIVFERERFRELRARALECLCERHTAAGRFGRAMDAGLAAVQNEPLRESAHRAVIRVHLAEGNQAEALRRYDAYRSLLSRQLGLEPSSGMRELVATLTVQ